VPGQVQAIQERGLVNPALLRIGAAADDDHFLERRLLLAAQARAVDVVAPAARGRAEADARRGAGRRS
jgi:hypothetical protein